MAIPSIIELANEVEVLKKRFCHIEGKLPQDQALLFRGMINIKLEAIEHVCEMQEMALYEDGHPDYPEPPERLKEIVDEG